MLTGVSSSRVMWQSFLERYTRLLMEANPKFPIYFLNIYSNAALRPGGNLLAGAACRLDDAVDADRHATTGGRVGESWAGPGCPCDGALHAGSSRGPRGGLWRPAARPRRYAAHRAHRAGGCRHGAAPSATALWPSL